jgi:ferredoxin
MKRSGNDGFGHAAIYSIIFFTFVAIFAVPHEKTSFHHHYCMFLCGCQRAGTNHTRCVACGNCLGVCKKDAISFSRNVKKNKP